MRSPEDLATTLCGWWKMRFSMEYLFTKFTSIRSMVWWWRWCICWWICFAVDLLVMFHWLTRFAWWITTELCVYEFVSLLTSWLCCFDEWNSRDGLVLRCVLMNSFRCWPLGYVVFIYAIRLMAWWWSAVLMISIRKWDVLMSEYQGRGGEEMKKSSNLFHSTVHKPNRVEWWSSPREYLSLNDNRNPTLLETRCATVIPRDTHLDH